MLRASASFTKSGTWPDGSPMDRLIGSLPGFSLARSVASREKGPGGKAAMRGRSDMARDHKGPAPSGKASSTTARHGLFARAAHSARRQSAGAMTRLPPRAKPALKGEVAETAMGAKRPSESLG